MKQSNDYVKFNIIFSRLIVLLFYVIMLKTQEKKQRLGKQREQIILI